MVQKSFIKDGSESDCIPMTPTSRRGERARTAMLEIAAVFLIMTVLLLSPFWIYYRMMVSQETRSHLNALLLHDIIKNLIKGIARLIKSTLALLITGVKKLLGL